MQCHRCVLLSKHRHSIARTHSPTIARSWPRGKKSPPSKKPGSWISPITLTPAFTVEVTRAQCILSAWASKTATSTRHACAFVSPELLFLAGNAPVLRYAVAPYKNSLKESASHTQACIALAPAKLKIAEGYSPNSCLHHNFAMCIPRLSPLP